MHAIHLHGIDYTILLAYVAFILGIGWVLARYMKSSGDFLTSSHSIPTWVTGLAFISANLGALELVGMAASGAQYGISTAHFYWVGAIPAMVFLSVFMMPFYYGSKARSTPEYLRMRFDQRVRFVNAFAFAVMTVFTSGISMDALADLLHLLLGWNFNLSLWICSVVVLLYVFKGGLTSAIYTEVLQFFLIVLGFAPVVWLGLKDVGGWSVLKQRLADVATNPAALAVSDKTFQSDAWTSAWKPVLAGSPHNPMGVDIFAMVFGLGFVLSFGYWCTNFLVVQRAMAAKNMTAARNTPLVAAIPKMLFPAIVILPGMIAIALATVPSKDYRIPPPIISDAGYAKAVAAVKAASPADLNAGIKAVSDALGAPVYKDKVSALISANAAHEETNEQIKNALYADVAENDYNAVIPSLVEKYCPHGLLALALLALFASFMSGMAGNITAFNTVWTYDLYQGYIAPNKDDRHYFQMGRVVTVVGTLLSIGCAYFASHYSNAMNALQLVFGFVNAPIFATFLLGMFWKRTTGTGAFLGLIGGILTSILFHALTLSAPDVLHPGIKGGYIHVAYLFPSEMAQNFWLASFAFGGCFLLTVLISLATKQTKTDEDLKGLVYSLTPKIKDHEQHFFLRPAVLGTILIIACVILNIIFW
ncbi:MAG: sodium:solute symporter family protein [Verrucomicrobiota bacterium]|nr:sodium:solute symporter family protein [Verrucomicrobiota bacterium]